MKNGTVEFFQLSGVNSVGKVVDELSFPIKTFATKQAFILWAQSALPERRGDPMDFEWPDAVRFVPIDGDELFRWTIWDQIAAGMRTSER